ncbi:hypothetical protein AC579_4164 [Pseudocercospora musae]|uniref:Uncharacterized protein n=1 Tax=Pseudocercospora musae TaxID=113226 RepID=A0A139IG34_9PEZI|nr:hypothetical protein AC579_4164 [Pseudocercospora musae]
MHLSTCPQISRGGSDRQCTINTVWERTDLGVRAGDQLHRSMVMLTWKLFHGRHDLAAFETLAFGSSFPSTQSKNEWDDAARSPGQLLETKAFSNHLPAIWILPGSKSQATPPQVQNSASSNMMSTSQGTSTPHRLLYKKCSRDELKRFAQDRGLAVPNSSSQGE